MIFDRIYRGNLWRGTESRSGPGSGSAATANVADAILRLVDEMGVTSVLDVACGDGWWMPDLPGYLGIDVSRVAIARARAAHPDRRYQVGDLSGIRDTFDLVIVRDAIQHLPLADGQWMLAGARARGRWVLASTFVGGENVDIEAGGAYSPDLTASPFWMPEPERMVFDGWGYADGSAVRDPRKHLALWPRL